MRVSLVYFDGCPNHQVTSERLRKALVAVGHDSVEVEHRRVGTAEEAERVGFRGSPTVLIDGQDPFLDPGSRVGLSFRIFRAPGGLTGSPTVEQLVEALR